MSTSNPESGAKKLKVAIAGASGFVGRALIEKLRVHYDLIALSRGSSRTEDGIEWRQCDLFNLKQAEQGLDGADIAIYLVHSMLPSAKLTQGSFADLDLLIADNFARAARKARVQRTIWEESFQMRIFRPT
jgi:nucleoside-diphosphate-sugar epimerase